MTRFIRIFGPKQKVSQADSVECVDKVLFSTDTDFIEIPEEFWSDLSKLLIAAEMKLGIILNTHEEEWIENREDLSYFCELCLQSIGVNVSVDHYLLQMSNLASSQANLAMPLIIQT